MLLKKITLLAAMGALIVALFPSALAQGGHELPKAKKRAQPMPQVDVTKLVWPLPPQIARIRFERQAQGERDLAGVKMKKPSWLEKASGVAVQNAELPRLRKPYGIAVDSKGKIYVGDSALHKVFVFDMENRKLTFRGDAPPAQFLVITGVAIDDRDRLFVSDANMHRMTAFDADGKFLAVFGEEKVKVPAGMAVDNDLRRLYVADAKGSRIAIFNLDTFEFDHYIQAKFATQYDSESWLGTPTNLAVDPDGLLYVVDTILNKIEVFDTEGNFVRTWGEQGNTPGKFARPKGIAIDSDGHIYVADDEFNNFQIFTPEGQVLMAVGGFGMLPGQFQLLTGLAFDNKGNRLIAGDAGPLPRIETFRYVTDEQAEAEKAKRESKGKGK